MAASTVTTGTNLSASSSVASQSSSGSSISVMLPNPNTLSARLCLYVVGKERLISGTEELNKVPINNIDFLVK